MSQDLIPHSRSGTAFLYKYAYIDNTSSRGSWGGGLWYQEDIMSLFIKALC
jgi:hypothetical protein